MSSPRESQREAHLEAQLRKGEKIQWISSNSVTRATDEFVLHRAKRRESRGVKGTLFHYYWMPACGASIGGAWGASHWEDKQVQDRLLDSASRCRVCKRCAKTEEDK